MKAAWHSFVAMWYIGRRLLVAFVFYNMVHSFGVERG
jgi:hypothetical protein